MGSSERIGAGDATPAGRVTRLEWDEIHLGMKSSFSHRLTDEDMRQFAALSGDVNPLHIDDAYARAAGYPGRVVYGMLTKAERARRHAALAAWLGESDSGAPRTDELLGEVARHWATAFFPLPVAW